MSFSKPIFRESKLGWYSPHRSHANSIVRQQAKVVLLGAAIVRNLTRYPSVWSRHLESFNSVTCGIGGDRTQNVLWRADNLYLPSSVRVVVIHCGTNNIDSNVYTPHDIAHGVIACGVNLRAKSGHLRVVAGILTISKKGELKYRMQIEMVLTPTTQKSMSHKSSVTRPPKDMRSPVLVQVPPPPPPPPPPPILQTPKDTDSLESAKGSIMSKKKLRGIVRKRANINLPRLLPPLNVVEEPEHEPWEPRRNNRGRRKNIRLGCVI